MYMDRNTSLAYIIQLNFIIDTNYAIKIKLSDRNLLATGRCVGPGLVHNRFRQFLGQTHQVVEPDESEEFLVGRIQRLIALHEAINEVTDHLYCPATFIGSALCQETADHRLKENA